MAATMNTIDTETDVTATEAIGMMIVEFKGTMKRAGMGVGVGHEAKEVKEKEKEKTVAKIGDIVMKS